MKFLEKGETLDHGCMVIETPKEYERILYALKTLEGMENGTLGRLFAEELLGVKS